MIPVSKKEFWDTMGQRGHLNGTINSEEGNMNIPGKHRHAVFKCSCGCGRVEGELHQNVGELFDFYLAGEYCVAN